MAMVDLVQMIGNLSQSLPSVNLLMEGFCYLLGAVFLIQSFIRFKDKAEEGRGGQQSTTGPFMYLGVAAMLFFLPSALNAFSNTLFGSNSSILQYSSYASNDIYNSMSMLIETAGLIWFIRGCSLLLHPPQDHLGAKRPGRKALFFIIAGLFAINFQSTVGAVNTALNSLMGITVTKTS